MASRHDVVLAILPLLILSGVVLQSFASALERLLGVGGVEQLPLALIGVLAAAALVGHELAVAPPAGEDC